MTIGIPGWLVGPNSFGIGITYMEYLQESLGCDELRILSPAGPVYSDLDMLVLPGGADINPARYGEPPSFYTDAPDLLKEYFDVHVLPRYIANNTAILSICRGMQSVCVAHGAKLIQNMWHDTNKQEDPTSGVHYLHIPTEPNRKVKVNSRHHQSVISPDASSPIKVLAVHKDKRHHVEAIRIEGKRILGLQWHPENCYESSCQDYTMSLINKYLLKK